jgi:hypothetical protein
MLTHRLLKDRAAAVIQLQSPSHFPMMSSAEIFAIELSSGGEGKWQCNTLLW